MTIPPVTSRPAGSPGEDEDRAGLIPDEPKNEGRSLFSASVTVRVTEARVEDVGHAVARLAAADLVRIGARPGDVLQTTGRLSAVARADLQAPAEPGTIQMDGTLRGNAGAGLEELVSVTRVEHGIAVSVRLASVSGGSTPTAITPERILEDLHGVPVVTGAIVRVPTFAKAVNFQVTRTIPSGPVVIDRRTDLRVVESDASTPQAPGVLYEDVGGLERELARVREIVELPLKNVRLFERLGILPPKGVLLHGPPGTGKTLLARAVAAESRVHFIHLNGPEIMRKFYGESEARLREVFEEAARHAPAIIFIDEIDAVAPKRAEVVGEVEKRVVAQLLGLMDGFVARGQVIVIGATNIPEVLDPALRRPGRFDREIEIGVPNVAGRLQILRIHTRAMPLAPDVRLEEIAEHTHGFVGADLEALCQEVGMITLRRFLSTASHRAGDSGAVDLGALVVTPDDVLQGLREVEPSATREFLLEKSGFGFEAVGGLDETKRLLSAIVEHGHVHDELYEQIGLATPRGILFTGPSGTGKTMMARALSGETGLPLIAVDGPQLFSKWLGESEKALRSVFKKARRAAPCLLFFDNVDTLVPRLADGGADPQASAGIYPRILSQMVREIDHLGDVKGVILLAATNRLERVDPALLRSGRFDYVIEFTRPDAAAREAIARFYCRRAPLAADVDLAELARRTEGRTGADVENACKKAMLVAIDRYRRQGSDGRFEIWWKDFTAEEMYAVMIYIELSVWTRGIIMDKEGRDVVNSIAAAGRKEGKHAQAMENYVDNPDRTNAPTRKYCRLSDSEIENALTYENEHPNIVVLVEGTMVKGWDYLRGMPPGGTLVINTHYSPDYMLRFVPGPERLAQLVCIDAAKLADHQWLYYRLGELGLDRLSTEGAAERNKAVAPDIAAPLIAAAVKATGIVKRETIEPMITNQAAFRAGWEALQVLTLNTASVTGS